MSANNIASTNGAGCRRRHPNAVPHGDADRNASPFIPPVIPQIFQNPAAQGIFAPGNRNTPVRSTPVPGAVMSVNTLQPPPVLRPPSTGDAGLIRLRSIW